MSSVTYYAQVIIALLIFVGILTLVIRFSQSIQRKKFTGEIKVLDRSTVDNGVTLLIVNVREKDYLLSIGGKEVKLLQELG